jgi:chromatin segregation and condensation protein Rec8/ScpA/Scc1 (kleisin family)
LTGFVLEIVRRLSEKDQMKKRAKKGNKRMMRRKRYRKEQMTVIWTVA